MFKTIKRWYGPKQDQSAEIRRLREMLAVSAADNRRLREVISAVREAVK